jgi:predicted nucleic acid-binding protein
LSRIYWDSMLFIYWLEDHPQYSARVQAIHDKMQQRRDTLCASAFVVGEVLAGPYKKDASSVIRAIQGYFRPPRVELLSFGMEAAERYAQIRAKHRVPPADAIHLATAATAGVDLFLTNDKALAGLLIPGIQFIAGMDVNLF